MDETRLKPDDASVSSPETPEDVAVLYTWANIPGGRYRDFSASRREFRAQQRHRTMEAQRQAELEAARSREEAAARDLEEVRPVEQLAESPEVVTSRASVEETLKLAEQERLAAQHHAETAAELKRVAELAQTEMEQARQRAEEQTARYDEADKLWRKSQGHTEETLPGHVSSESRIAAPQRDSSAEIGNFSRRATDRRADRHDGDTGEQRSQTVDLRHRRELAMDLSTRTERRPRSSEQFAQSGEHGRADIDERGDDLRRDGRDYRAEDERENVPDGDVSPEWLLRNRSAEDVIRERLQANAREIALATQQRLEERRESEHRFQTQQRLDEDRSAEQLRRRAWDRLRGEDDRLANEAVNLRSQQDRALLSNLPPMREQVPIQSGASSVERSDRNASSSREASDVSAYPSIPTPADTLQQSRERVAARWFALKGLMSPGTDLQDNLSPAKELQTPCLSIISLSGGVGKTSLVATLGRALSSVGEKVLLADTTPYGLLPYYFGARELRPDVVRTFSPPPGSSDAPVYMVNYETDRLNGDEVKQAQMVEEMMRHAAGAGRILLDLNGSSVWLARLLTRYHSNILVPIAADMNSVLSIQRVDRFFSGSVDGAGRPVAPYYVLNQFDASQPLHLDVREVLRQQLGNRLLPLMIRRSPAVPEALAEGMTVIDYAPDSAVTEDYKNLAQWVRALAAPATTSLRSIRWSER
jgi:cellulose synthase operon protein YhjQ